MIFSPTLLTTLLAAALAAPDVTDGDVAALVRAALVVDARQQALSPDALGRAASVRPDGAVAAEVRDLLAQHLPGLTGLSVSCSGGEVVLRGRAPDADVAARALELAGTIPGVRAVTSALATPGQPPAPPAPAAAEPAPALTGPFAYLTWDRLAGAEVSVLVVDGIVELRGVASSARSRDYATAAARLAPGARGVRNLMVIRPASLEDDERLARMIHRQLEWTVELQPFAENLGVGVTDGIVILTGWVATETERQLAIERARSTRGILVVDDRLQLLPGGDPLAAR